ncbi:hypothetical protein SBRCBS47491_005166 [Sporothrix bragantina]|uniref:Calcineurin-like phosphoesterase domain-containing protein n=1 Tax=Sporothrix bragantina TaxID=671064 RepID=A0ABP0BUI4_9PEZI
MKAFTKLANRLSYQKPRPVAPDVSQQPDAAAEAPVEPPPAPSSVNGSIQVLSDLHLEVCTQYATFKVTPTGAPYLVLAGDIGRLIDYEPLLGFLAGLVVSYRRVFYVLGNHEFYTMTYDQGISEAQRLEKEPILEGKVSILHRTRWDEDLADVGNNDAPRLIILGCTLWTQVVPEAHDAVCRSVSDFKYIRDWSVDSHNRMHNEEVAWLHQQVDALHKEASDEAESKKRTVIIVTHHVPSVEGTSQPKYAASPWASAFATELVVPAGAWDGVSTWIFGHTHYSNDFVREGVRLVANQRGYVFPPNPNAVALGQCGKGDKTSGAKGFRVLERKAEVDDEHGFNPTKTISYY